MKILMKAVVRMVLHEANLEPTRNFNERFGDKMDHAQNATNEVKYNLCEQMDRMARKFQSDREINTT